MLKSHLILATLLSVSGNVFALSKDDFAGQYNLKETLNGVCPETIHGELQELLNETSSPTLSFYCKQDSLNCDRVIYQLTDINSGKQVRYQQNPMTGFYDSVYYSNQSLNGNIIRAFNQTSRMNGSLLWRTTFKAVLEANSFTYIFEEQNNIVHTATANHCRYTKVK